MSYIRTKFFRSYAEFVVLCIVNETRSFNQLANKVELDATFGTTTSNDVSELHPCQFCQKCFCHLKNYKARKTVSPTIPIKWADGKNSNCETYILGGKKSVGGRPRKATHSGGRPKPLNTIDDLLTLDPSKPIPANVERLISQLVQRKMNESTMRNRSVQCNTGGSQPLVLPGEQDS